VPTAALRICGKAACYNLVGNGRVCPIHPPRKAWATSKAPRQARGYDADHDALRRQVAKEEHDCRTCHSTVVPWVMDHIAPFTEGGTTVRDNVQRLCPACSKRKTAQEALRAAKRRYGIPMDSGEES
jgi:5-methylcytosine-specific restriction protein A